MIELLPERERLEVLRLAKHIRLANHTILVHPDRKVEFLYFPESCVISAVANFTTGATAEMSAVGREGYVPVMPILGSDRALATHIVQVPGKALQFSRSTLFSHMHRLPGLRVILNRYLLAFLGQVLQSVACNATHTVEQRCAKWLLTIRDRTGSKTFHLTHEDLGQLLGVTRQHMSVVAGTMQSAGLIRYQRGTVTIVDGVTLEEAACECYGAVGRMYREHVEAAPGLPK